MEKIKYQKKIHIFYFFIFLFVIYVNAYLYDKGKFLLIILMSIHMVYGLKLMIPFSKFKKNRALEIDFCIDSYCLKFIVELMFALFFSFILFKYILPSDHPLGDNFKLFFIFYLVYAIFFSLLSINIKKQKK